MKINTDFITPKDAPLLNAAAQQNFLVQKDLQVLEVENAIVAPGWQGGVWVNNKHLPQTWLHWREAESFTPPPRICNLR